MTSSPEVRSFLNRQPVNTKTDYQLLQKALIKEFADPESEQGLVAALGMRQGRHEPIQAYYSRLRLAYFGTHNELDMKDELNFKTLFLEEPSSRYKPQSLPSRMSTNNERSAVVRIGAESLRQTIDGLR